MGRDEVRPGVAPAAAPEQDTAAEIRAIIAKSKSTVISNFSPADADTRYGGLFETLGTRRGYIFNATDRWATVDNYWTPKLTLGKIDLDTVDDDDDDDDPFAKLAEAVAASAAEQAAMLDLAKKDLHNPTQWLVNKLELLGFKVLAAGVPGPPRYPSSDLLLETPGALIAFNRTGDSLSVALLADNLKRLDEVHGNLRVAFPEKARPAIVAADGTPRCTVSFWSYGQHGPDVTPRNLEVVDWEKSRFNYPVETQKALENLMAWQPARSGQLLLWHGPPGTGKTWGIRALAWAWREWCTVHYVMDTANLLSGPPAYTKALFLHTDRGRKEGKAQPKWRLVVLEDAGELISQDAREQAGQGLSRLLNIADGLLGQGSRTVMLITTNENIDALHPAIKRPGRCHANVNFPTFGTREANTWFQASGVDYTTARPMTLAEMFEQRDSRLQQVEVGKVKEKAMGFK
jgi:hypothetical protein